MQKPLDQIRGHYLNNVSRYDHVKCKLDLKITLKCATLAQQNNSRDILKYFPECLHTLAFKKNLNAELNIIF